MRRNMLNSKFYKYGEKVYMLVATSVYLEYNCGERYLTVESDLGNDILYTSKGSAFSNR